MQVAAIPMANTTAVTASATIVDTCMVSMLNDAVVRLGDNAVVVPAMVIVMNDIGGGKSSALL